MRFITTLIITSFFILGACKDSNEEIGTFDVTLNGEQMVFSSIFDAEDERSNIQLMSPSGIKLILIDGSAGVGQQDLPIISLSIQGGVTSSKMSLMFVEVFDQSYDTVLSSDGPNGNRQMQNFKMGEDGSISFDFTADLQRVTTQTEEPVEGAKMAHIEGSFKGKIPASEMKE